jgi:hypothetical protein
MLNEEFMVEDYLEELATPAAPPQVQRKPKDYPQNFCMELALGLEDEDALCIRYNITPYEYECLKENHAFQKDLSSWRSRVAEEGLSFKLKARVQSEMYLQEIDNIVYDPSTSPETKLNAITRCVEWAGLGPKQQVQSSGEGRVVIRIESNIGSVIPTTAKVVGGKQELGIISM